MSKYLTIAMASLDKLNSKVNEAIEEGWKPLGGICVDKSSGEKYFFQAMIRNE